MSNELEIDSDKIIADVQVWLESEEGQRELAESMEALEKDHAEMIEAMKIPWHLMHTPIGTCLHQ